MKVRNGFAGVVLPREDLQQNVRMLCRLRRRRTKLYHPQSIEFVIPRLCSHLFRLTRCFLLRLVRTRRRRRTRNQYPPRVRVCSPHPCALPLRVSRTFMSKPRYMILVVFVLYWCPPPKSRTRWMRHLRMPIVFSWILNVLVVIERIVDKSWHRGFLNYVPHTIYSVRVPPVDPSILFRQTIVRIVLSTARVFVTLPCHGRPFLGEIRNRLSLSSFHVTVVISKCIVWWIRLWVRMIRSCDVYIYIYKVFPISRERRKSSIEL